MSVILEGVPPLELLVHTFCLARQAERSVDFSFRFPWSEVLAFFTSERLSAIATAALLAGPRSTVRRPGDGPDDAVRLRPSFRSRFIATPLSAEDWQFIASRFAILAWCALSVLAGFGVEWLLGSTTAPTGRAAVLATVLVALCVEAGSAPLPLVRQATDVPPIYRFLKNASPTVIIELPQLDYNPTYMFWSTYHWHSLINGYSGYAPPDDIETGWMMETFPDDDSIERLQAHLFVLDDLPRPPVAPGFRMWRSSITAGELERTVARYLGAERAQRSFAEYAESSNALCWRAATSAALSAPACSCISASTNSSHAPRA